MIIIKFDLLLLLLLLLLILIHGVPKTLCMGTFFMLPCGHGPSVGVLDWILPACLGVFWFELCFSQKCYAMTWIALTHPKVPHAMSTISSSGPGFVH